MQIITIKIAGMTCMGCVNSVKTVVEKLPGVSRANVSLNPSQAMIEFDPNKITIDQIKTAIIDAGFDVAESITTVE